MRLATLLVRRGPIGRWLVVTAYLLQQPFWLQTLAEASALRVHGIQYVCRDPCTQHFSIRVEPRAENLALIVGVDAENYFRESAFAIDAEAAPVCEVTWRDIPAGHYVLTIELIRLTGSRPYIASRLQTAFKVI